MSRDNLGFAIFMTLLLIAPKLNLKIPGGAERSSVSLGIIGLVLWYLAYPQKLSRFPKLSLSHPLTWLVVFAIYAFIVSLLSTNIVSIVYSVQYLLYVVIGTILMRRYAPSFISSNSHRARSIFFVIAVVFTMGILISIFTGPIYLHQVQTTHRHWGGLTIQQGVGFSEAYNIAASVVIFFAAACIYLYRGKTWKKWTLLTLVLFALLATLSRGAIFSFIGALVFVYWLDNLGPFFRRARFKTSLLKRLGFAILFCACAMIVLMMITYFTHQPLLPAILGGFGLGQQSSVVSRDMASRFAKWTWGLNVWASGKTLTMIFGGGFRSSMTILSKGTWHSAHNVYIAILGDFGIVGLTLFLASLFGALLRYVRLFLTDKAGRFEKFGLMTVLALSIHNMTEVYLYSPICLSLLIFTFAVTL